MIENDDIDSLKKEIENLEDHIVNLERELGVYKERAHKAESKMALESNATMKAQKARATAMNGMYGIQNMYNSLYSQDEALRAQAQADNRQMQAYQEYLAERLRGNR